MQGVDKNFDFHWQNNIPGDEVHVAGNDVQYRGQTVQYPFTNNINHHIKIDIQEKKFKFYIDGNQIYDTEDHSYVFSGHEQMGLRFSAGSVFPTEVYFDNIIVTTSDSANLAVPLLKQTDPLWANDLYDSANLWSTGATGIDRWGCALTSAVMVLQYNQINKLPNDQVLTPGTLNSWLKSVPDGYVRNGNVNWLAISRMTRLSKINNPNFGYDALEYKRVNGINNTLLTTDLNNGLPAIIEEPGHFVVAKGINSNTYNINDPFYSKTTLAEYNNTYSSYGKFVPSNTDLSYLKFVVDPSVDIVVRDSSGNPVGEVYTENPISDPLNLLGNSVGPLKVIYFAKPPTDNYKVYISSNTLSQYHLDGYLYDVNGDVKILTTQGSVNSNDTDVYNLFEDHNYSALSGIISFDKLLSDINVFYQIGKITKKGSYNYLLNKISSAKGYSLTNPTRAKDLLTTVRNQLVDDKKKGIDSEASAFIIHQIDLLMPTF